jgi:hypothetical protein
MSSSSAARAQVPARVRGGCWRWCLGRLHDRGWPGPLESACSPSRGSPWPAALADNLRDEHGELQATDPSLTGAGGAAFLWEDVLTIGDLVDVLRPMLGGFAPNESAKLLVKLLSTWGQLRRTRVMLSKAEFAVLLAVKRGRKTAAEISAYTGIDRPTVQSTIDALSARHYKEEITLLEGSPDALATKF